MTPAVARAMQTMLGQLVGERYHVGDRLPTVRAWAKTAGVSRTTAAQALALLKEQGIVASREGSFTYLRRRPDAAEVAATTRRTPRERVTLWVRNTASLRRMRLAMLRHEFHRQFAAQYPDIEILEQDPESRSPRAAHLLRSMLTGGGPTVAELDVTSLPMLIESNAVTPLLEAGQAADE